MAKFTAENEARLDELVSRYPNKRAALLPALWVAQEVYGGCLRDCVRLPHVAAND